MPAPNGNERGIGVTRGTGGRSRGWPGRSGRGARSISVRRLSSSAGVRGTISRGPRAGRTCTRPPTRPAAPVGERAGTHGDLGTVDVIARIDRLEAVAGSLQPIALSARPTRATASDVAVSAVTRRHPAASPRAPRRLLGDCQVRGQRSSSKQCARSARGSASRSPRRQTSSRARPAPAIRAAPIPPALNLDRTEADLRAVPPAGHHFRRRSAPPRRCRPSAASRSASILPPTSTLNAVTDPSAPVSVGLQRTRRQARRARSPVYRRRRRRRRAVLDGVDTARPRSGAPTAGAATRNSAAKRATAAMYSSGAWPAVGCDRTPS